MMKKNRAKLTLVLIATLALFTGCGPNAPSSTFNPAAPPTGGSFTGNVPGGSGTTGGCIGIDQRIPFNGNSIYVDSHNIFGGQIPGESTSFGTVTVGGATGTTNYSATSIDGLLQMGFTYSQQSSKYNSTGLLMISSYTQQDIRANYPAMQQICVTGVSFDFGYYDTTLYGSFYLYFNNTQNGYMLVF